ncbi:hypothetical protein [Manganibacter manganicus]|uniref:Uncharacterized protein n=1 Tax=Manganibacter manganicus TaxID=1873176 RepID=A0A1V8RMQ2_9HYPH|nr:hypothetical protein [Pseudaminobacter manganicus]OQM74467.1 hypothetical protein BFN67_21925 [Pseudaminobacter manganicus]
MPYLARMIVMIRGRLNDSYCLGHTHDDTAANRAVAGRSRLLGFGVLAAAMILSVTAFAQVPDEFLGKWSTDPGRCEQINGEADMLEVVQSGFQFYEIGCEVKKPIHSANPSGRLLRRRG